MTRLTATARLLARDAFLVLATLAIALKILIPAGFMPGQDQRNGLPFAMVLCTGEGAKIVAPGHSLDGKSDADGGDKSAHDTPCPFAAQGAAAPAPVIATLGQALAFAPAIPVTFFAGDVSPGRGLAAPPPPSTGPPSLLI